jgi:hypothetical protein
MIFLNNKKFKIGRTALNVASKFPVAMLIMSNVDDLIRFLWLKFYLVIILIKVVFNNDLFKIWIRMNFNWNVYIKFNRETHTALLRVICQIVLFIFN